MNIRGINFLEEHIEKVVLAIVGLVCLWLLVTRVVMSPNTVQYDNKNFGAGSIDNHISERVQLLKKKLNQKPEPKQPYKRRFDELMVLVDSTITDVDTSLSLPQPGRAAKITVKRKYRIPPAVDINGVRVGQIRAVAYVPTKEINERNIGDASIYRPDDIDLVTVEAKFDIGRLYENFYECFTGEQVREQWRDPCLAKPIFAAVQLQRQQLLVDGTWSNWQTVPRTKADHRKRIFEVIEDVQNLPPGGIEVKLIQFDDAQLRMDLLQPRTYMIASPKQEWFPPTLHEKFLKHQQEVETQEKREAQEAQRQAREREREEVRSERARQVRSRPRAGAAEDEFSLEGAISTVIPQRRTPTRRRPSSDLSTERTRPERSRDIVKPTIDVYAELDKVLITNETNLAKITEPLMFWACDDTAEEGKTYRYRIRLGVFNPIAGTNQFHEQYKSSENKVILWSGFSKVTQSITVPKTLYFFSKDVQQAAKTVTVQVSRYALGYWYSKDFIVGPGETIGKIVESETGQELEVGVLMPQEINYSTNAVLVDVVPVSDWSGSKALRPRHYFDMLYSFDDGGLERVPVKTRYWPEELQAKFNEIKKSQKEPKEPLRPWGSGPLELRRAGQEAFDEDM